MPPHDAGPRDGDYAAHLDRLINQSAGAPGQIMAPARVKKRRFGAAAARVLGRSGDAPVGADEATPAVPASHSGGRPRIGVIRYLIVVFLLFNAVRELGEALRFGSDIEDFVPALFMFGIAYILLRQARNARQTRK